LNVDCSLAGFYAVGKSSQNNSTEQRELRFFNRERNLKKSVFVLLGILIAACLVGGAQTHEVLKPPPHSRNEAPSLTFSVDGTLWLAWSSFRDGRFHLAVSSKKNNTWTSIQYPDSSEMDQMEPQWLMEKGLRPALVYSVYRDREWTVRFLVKTVTGWKNPQELGQGKHPCGVQNGSRLWVAWEKDGSIEIKQMGGLTDSLQVLKPDSPDWSYSHPRLAIGSRGQVWLTFCASRLGYQSVKLMRMDEEPGVIITVDDGSGVNREPRISLDASGRVWIVYEALESVSSQGDLQTGANSNAGYVLDRTFRVKCPSLSVVVTDGKLWWRPVRPQDPAIGLMPNIHCGEDGTVWILSRSYTGNKRPRREFYPLSESLGTTGWVNNDVLCLEQRGYKELMPVAESPKGEIWTAWIPNNRLRLGFQDDPSWTFTDGDDFLAVARLPQPERAGDPILIPFKRSENLSLAQESFPHYETTYQDERLRVYFGDLHQHSEFSGCGRLNGSIDQNQHYTRFVRGLDFMSTIDHSEHLNDHNWRAHQLVSERNNHPGRFVTFSGFEWTSEFDAGGNLYRGHYNTIFRKIGEGDFYFSASDTRTNTPLKLWDALKKAVGSPENVLTFAHHTSRRMAWLTWNYYDPDMAPLIEIAQARGSYEYEGCFSQQLHLNDCARVSGHFIHDGLARGMRWGFVAAGDHGGRQLTAVFAPKLTRESLFQNLKNKHTYATNGERMFLDMRVNGRFMGEEFTLEEDNRTIDIHVRGTTSLVQVDLFRNGRIIRQFNPNNMEFKTSWTDKEPLMERENYYYLRAIQKNGGQAWASPIWVINPRVPGVFRFQLGGDELHVLYPGEERDISVLMHNEMEGPVSGTIHLQVPAGWVVKESGGIHISCPPGAWRHAVFSVMPGSNSITKLCLPEVLAVFEGVDGMNITSQIFAVGSPSFLSRERKAVLMDARRDLSVPAFLDYFKRMEDIWIKEDK